jgi:peptidoglycan/LPS O-acetylase OafA/YrhL
VAIHAFFLISGYLIVGSYIKDPRVLSYLTERIVRISRVCGRKLGLSLGNRPIIPWKLTARWIVAPKALVRLAFLQSPEIVGAFEGSPYPVLDGATWTIAYEFRCYLLVILLGLAGAFRNPQMISGLVALGLVIYLSVPPEAFGGIDSKLAGTGYWLGILESAISLATAFLTGLLYFPILR